MRTTTIPDDAQPRLASGVRVQIDRITGNGVLLFAEGIMELNETAQAILVLCDGRTLTEIVRSLAEDYDVDPAALAADVRQTVTDLQRRKLVEIA